ncbi:hypothetical protein [Chitinophaga sp. Cy-1792]|uniref:hypothetical protein n=1 Tax=Chitinophaga sp. Cy-1792 TaxID=2608339 RepID=UPI0014217482|nr:hypothetical protein [Chitinophaga sp. Cy-1792]NIG55279.1 hypothetical protein [Chitinophaga sp. Cy-1792]
MKKIPTLFERTFEKGRVTGITSQVTAGCEWVLAGEGIATKKWDGTCVFVEQGITYKRYDAKHGKTPPEGFVPAQPDADPVTGHWPGWMPLSLSPDKWIAEAVTNYQENGATLIDGTYEAIGPKINGNRDAATAHILKKHGDQQYETISHTPLTYDAILAFLQEQHTEGIVFHHPDGRMSKIKRSDFDLSWK